MKICTKLLIPPAEYLGKYTAHIDYTEEEVRRISISSSPRTASVFVSPSIISSVSKG